MIDVRAVTKILREGSRFLCTMHKGPDGDGIGSAMALAAAVRAMGKTAVVYSEDGVPRMYHFLRGADRVVREVSSADRWDATFVFDCGDLTRMGSHFPPKERAGVLVNFDHHVTNTRFGDLNVIDDHAAAVGEMVYHVVNALGVTLDREMAEAMYVSITSDTGSFKYSNTRPETMRVAADCLAAGADPWLCAQRVFDDQPLAKLRLTALVLPTLELHAYGKIASLVISSEMFAASGADQELTEGLVNYARSVEGVEAAVLVRETPTPGTCKVSLRSRGTVDVAATSLVFGGGGHRAAAGATVKGSLVDIKNRVVAALISQIRA